MIRLRHTTEADLPRVEEILDRARRFLAEQGVDQWQAGYPNLESIRGDMARRESYVLDAGEGPRGVMALCFRPDATYRDLVGSCLNEEPYAVIHRLAVADPGKGDGGLMIEAAELLCKMRGISNVRVDTHRDNRPMNRLLQKRGFVPCGTVTCPVPAGDPLRTGYHRVIPDGCACEEQP